MAAELVDDLVTRFLYLWNRVYFMAETDAERLNVGEVALGGGERDGKGIGRR